MLSSGIQAFSQSEEVNLQIKQVENNLIPFVPVKGFKGWNILDRMKYYQVPGLSIAVIKNYKIDWAKGYGIADTTLQNPVSIKTMFSAGSISKLLLAVTAFKMTETGMINLDNPVNNYLTSWQVAENDFTKRTPITMKMLLSHTAGTSQASYFGFTPTQPLPSILEILNGDKMSTTRPVVVNSEPNKEFRYSGGGSMIAQLTLMDVSKQTFHSLAQNLIFDKLEMKNSTFEQPVPSKFKNQTAWAYSSASWFKGMPYVYPQQAAAGLYTTPTDLAKFFIDVQKSYIGKGKILSQSAVKQMLTPQQTVSDGTYKEQIGIGPFLIQRSDNQEVAGTYFEFTGVNAGFLAYGIASITNGNGVVIMLNSGDDVNGLGKELRKAVAKVYGWTNFLPDELIPVDLTDAELNKFTGRYRMSENEVLYLRKENNYLIENINEGNDIYCFPIKKDTIVFTDYNIKAGFKFNDKGEVVSLLHIPVIFHRIIHGFTKPLNVFIFPIFTSPIMIYLRNFRNIFIGKCFILSCYQCPRFSGINEQDFFFTVFKFSVGSISSQKPQTRWNLGVKKQLRWKSHHAIDHPIQNHILPDLILTSRV
jgi:CubicO group peptidase (beta-lactamase class C family)